MTYKEDYQKSMDIPVDYWKEQAEAIDWFDHLIQKVQLA